MTESREHSNIDEESEWNVVAQRVYEREGPDDLTTVIIEAVAAAEGIDATEVTDPPLYEVVDASAIEASFFGQEAAGESRDSSGTVQFEYRGFRVTVRSDGWVQVAKPAERRS